MLIRLTFILIILSLSLSSILDVYITNNTDYIGNINYCNNNNNVGNSCNIRSAFEYCNLYSDINNECRIILQLNSTISFNPIYGSILLNSSSQIMVIGNSSTISFNSNVNYTYSNFIVYDNSSNNDIPILKLHSICFKSFHSKGVNDFSSSSSIIYMNGDSFITLDSCVFINSISQIGSLYFNSNSQQIMIINSIFLNNYGASSLSFDSYIRNVSIINSTFYNNYVTSNGAAISFYSSSSNINITSCTFTSNKALSGYGGAIFFAYETFKYITIYKCTFISNRARYGGCISTNIVDLQYFTIDSSYFQYNTVSYQGGVFYGSDSNISDAVLTNSYYISNKSGIII